MKSFELNLSELVIKEVAEYSRKDRVREGITTYALATEKIPELEWRIKFPWGYVSGHEEDSPLKLEGDTIWKPQDLAAGTAQTRGNWRLKNPKFVQEKIKQINKAIREQLGEILFLQELNPGWDPIVIAKKDGIVTVWKRGEILAKKRSSGEQVGVLFRFHICEEA